MLTLAPRSTRRRSRPAGAPIAAAPIDVSPTSVVVPKSRLELILIALAEAHTGHAAGPVFPCPLCFSPRLFSAAI